MNSLSPEAPGPGFIGQVLDGDGATVGTCWLVAPGWVLTAAHVAQAAGADVVAASVAAAGRDNASHDDGQTVTLWLRRGLAETGPVIEGRVRRADTVVDLALVEIDAESWDSAPAGLADSEDVKPKEVVVVAGAAELADAREDAALIASSTAGRWDGWGLFNDSLRLAKITTPGVPSNMSGAPVIRVKDNAVLGLVTGRYNSADGWDRDMVWVVGGRAIEQFCRPVVGSLLPPPPAPTQAVHVVLRPTRETVSLVCEELDTWIVEPCRGARSRLFPTSERLRLARKGLVEAQRSGKRAPGGRVDEPTPLLDALKEIGSTMGEVFLPGAVGEALTRILAKARSQTIPMEFAVDLTECPELRGLPWEGLRHPEVDGPLALHPLVTFYRLAVASPTPRRVEGPLRIVVAIAAPLDDEPKLDYESELRNIVPSVREAKAGGADARIVTFATTAEIKKALGMGDVHVLHISCHGSAGQLILEDENGKARPVTARTLIEEAIPPGKMPPVICLSACDANVTDLASGLPVVADELVSSGAPAVIGMETSVSDRYATLVFARVYAELAKATNPDPATALAAARREILQACENSERSRDRGEQVLSGWSVVTVHAALSRETLFDPTTVRPSRNGSSPVVPEVGDLPALRPGSFVGRRREQLEIPRLLADEDRGGVVLHGIGGIGKTSLANEILRRASEQRDGVVFVTLSGEVTAEEVLQGIITELRIDSYSQGQLPDPRFLGKLEFLRDPRTDWNSRIGLLRREFLKRIPIIVVLDNFEDNLSPANRNEDDLRRDDFGSHGGRRIKDRQLADFLAAVAKTSGPSALLITCRYRFELPDDGGEYLRWWGLGPLSFSETLRLAWDLPHVEALDDYQLHMLWASIGGHPRTLEMLDALLGHGRGRLTRIAQELRQRLKKTLPDGMDVASWLNRPRDLDTSIAEAVTLAANDVLLPQFLDLLSPEARHLLEGLAIFRQPVERSAAIFVLGTFMERDTTENETNDATDLPFTTDLPVDDLLDELVSTTLLTRLESADGSSPQWFVHRWIAFAIEHQEGTTTKTTKKNNTDRHRRAALYWLWHYRVTVQSQEADTDDLLEFYVHLSEAGDIEKSDDIAQRAASILNRIGRWDDERKLANRQLQNLRLNESRQSTWHHQLGVLAQARGDYDTARTRYQQALAIFEALGDRAGMATTYHQLGVLAQARGDYDTARKLYQQALAIFEELGGRAGMANTYGQLGVLAQLRGDYDTARKLYEQSLHIKEELGDRASMANTYHNLGILAQLRSDYDTARKLYEQSLHIKEELGDRAGMANTYHNLGILAQDQDNSSAG